MEKFSSFKNKIALSSMPFVRVNVFKRLNPKISAIQKNIIEVMILRRERFLTTLSIEKNIINSINRNLINKTNDIFFYHFLICQNIITDISLNFIKKALNIFLLKNQLSNT